MECNNNENRRPVDGVHFGFAITAFVGLGAFRAARE
jgi:hypothetical protein